MFSRSSFPRTWPWIALVVSALMLAVAQAFETFGHLAPCTLCLRQREIYWEVMGIAAIGGALGLTGLGRLATWATNVLLTGWFFLGAGVAIYHAGAEWKWWQGQASCRGGIATVSAAEINALLRGAKMSIPACDKPAWVFLGLSMAGWNALISIGLAGVSAFAALNAMKSGAKT
jgi:disulfide bond formation protein DsbB